MDTLPAGQFRERLIAELRGNILPFWMRQTIDRRRGGFFGEISNDLVAQPDAVRGALLTSRILWTFAAAYRHFPEPAYLETARWACADLLTRFWDREHGGLFWSAGADGAPVETRKQIYGQAFGIYALTELHRATREPEPLARAIELFRLIEQHSRDERHGGYFEAFGRGWEPLADMRLSAVDLNEPKSQNTHLHVMEAYTNLLRVWPDAALRGRQHELVELMLTRVFNPTTRHLGLFFDAEWQPRSNHISYGHDVEASWLLTEAADVLGDVALASRVRGVALELAEASRAEGVDADGGMFNEADPDGLVSADKEWWPQAEAVIGFFNAYQLTREERWLHAAQRSWQFIDHHLIDRQHGEWRRGVTRDGRVLDQHPKVSFWKCPYHNGRMCLEMIDRIAAQTPAAQPR